MNFVYKRIPAHTVVHEHRAKISHKVDYEENSPLL